MPSPPVRRMALLLVFLLLSPAVSGAATGRAQPSADVAKFRGWIEEFKNAERGPFERIRWFCKDGTVQPPKAYACKNHGGGVQHGEWNSRAKQMRAAGYAIATLMARVDPGDFTGNSADMEQLAQILLERFLISWDDGWIMRGARSYRGAFQIEDEEAGAKRLLLAMLADPDWQTPARFALLRESARLLPLPGDDVSAAHVRQVALEIAQKDAAFTPLRAKIHNVPDAGDAKRVREYAQSKGKAALAGDYEGLAAAIDDLYAVGATADDLAALAPKTQIPAIAKALRDGASALRSAGDPKARLAAAGTTMTQLRDLLPEADSPEIGLGMLQASLSLESDAYTAGNTLATGVDKAGRRDRLRWLQDATTALYGAGFISRRHVAGVNATMKRIVGSKKLSLDAYRQELRYLARGPEWSGRWLVFNFGPAVEKFVPIEPLTHLYTQDRLRGSPLLFYSAVIDSLVRDANRVAGIEHELFGRRIGTGLRALNPGMARGTLYVPDANGGFSEVVPDGIYLLPETTSDLPPVSGILTLGEGSSLSHVQLLARNLGIPNVVVGKELLDQVRKHVGSPVVLAVSPGGVVQLTSDDPARWDEIFGKEEAGGVTIRPDLEKLDIRNTRFVRLSKLRATDSGILSGPKGANLGELKHSFGEAVPPGFVIPFGVFRELLDKPLDPGGKLSVWDWMKERYATIARLEGQPQEQARAVSEFLGRLRDWIVNSDPGPEFRRTLKSSLDEAFGPDGEYGVFVRSDTNVEDLPGFTGAGLNLTVFNVVGSDKIFQAIRDVWASPFTERAYGWRQSHMTQPEYVFPAVVIQYAFPSEKSGVLVTTDVERGEPGWITVAINEGVGGAVDGQASESLRINTNTGEVRFLAQATAPHRLALLPEGGIDHVSASGTAAVLKPAETRELIAFAKSVPVRFPSLRDEAGKPMPADVEFAFRNGKLILLQMRPFVESDAAQRSSYLTSLDEGTRKGRK